MLFRSTWTGLIPLGYQVLPEWQILGVWNGSTPMRWFIYLPVFALLLWEARRFLPRTPFFFRLRDGIRTPIPRS